MNFKKCKICGTISELDVPICPECGRVYDDVPQEETIKPKRSFAGFCKTYKKPIIITLCIIVGYILIFLLAYGIQKDKPSDYVIKNNVLVSYTGLNKSPQIPESVTEIGIEAFQYCDSIREIVIPNTVTKIDDYAFNGCENLEKIVIPASVTSIGNGAFNSENITTIIVDSDNPVYDSRNNCNAIIETETNELIRGCKNTVIPDDIKTIGKDAFYKCANLYTIVIPEGVQEIKNCAFGRCTNLTTITLPESLNTIGRKAFYDCNNLESIRIPSGVTKIEDSTFTFCKKLKTITLPNTIEVIEEEFDYCNSLEKIIYQGTKDEWRQIEITGLLKVDLIECIDGEIDN